MPGSPLHVPILSWYARNARDLPWRRPDASPWGIFVSEIMLQQTPVARVEPVWREWLARWPVPAALAAASPGDAVRAWGRLGYPRRALRLHEAAQQIVDRHGGHVPGTYADLRALPGVGDYTAAAVASFAFGRRHAVLDTNVRRVLARAVERRAGPASAPTAADRRLAERLMPDDGPLATRWAVSVMELGALVCTSRAARCGECPIALQCAWYAAGRPVPSDGRRPRQTYAGTDRQVRGLLMAVLRDCAGPVAKHRLDAVWGDDRQRERALDGLVADGLVEPVGDDAFQLPESRSTASR